MSGNNFTSFKLTEEIGKGNIKIIPDILIGGGNIDGNITGSLGMKLIDKKKEKV